MADTKHHAPLATFDGGSGRPEHGRGAPVEGDGISYSGIVWFIVILTITTLVCQILMVVLFNALAYQKAQADLTMQASPLAPPATERQGVSGQVYPGMVAIGQPNGPAPQLLVREPVNLDALRAHEQEVLTTYGWSDRNTGSYRIPIERAKELIIERGLPVRGADAAKDVKTVKEVKK